MDGKDRSGHLPNYPWETGRVHGGLRSQNERGNFHEDRARIVRSGPRGFSGGRDQIERCGIATHVSKSISVGLVPTPLGLRHENEKRKNVSRHTFDSVHGLGTLGAGGFREPLSRYRSL